MQQYEAYPFVLSEGKTHYHFQSIGKRGVFEKAIEFSPITNTIYNLALLDFDPETQDYIDDIVTNNGDMPEVLCTVMNVALHFLSQHPQRMIIVTGNSDSRTRLYQIAIGKVFSDIQELFSIKGFRDGGWVDFEPNGSFESFLVAGKFLNS